MHDNLAVNPENNRKIIVLGDSYAEGMGDELQSNVEDYGLVRKLDNGNTDYIVAGRSGYGNLGTYNEALSCLDFLADWTSWNYEPQSVEKLILIFYEGNDLNDNLREAQRMDFDQELSLRRKLSILLPIFEIIQTFLGEAKYAIMEFFLEPNTQIDGVLNSTKSGLKIPSAIRAAATELNVTQLVTALKIATDVISKLSKAYPEASFDLLYLPSVASSYDFDSITIQTFQDGDNVVSGSFNENRSRLIRNTLSDFCTKEAICSFCDTTPDVKEFTSDGVFAHGPLDWDHFNREGYRLVKQSYDSCLASR